MNIDFVYTNYVYSSLEYVVALCVVCVFTYLIIHRCLSLIPYSLHSYYTTTSCHAILTVRHATRSRKFSLNFASPFSSYNGFLRYSPNAIIESRSKYLGTGFIFSVWNFFHGTTGGEGLARVSCWCRWRVGLTGTRGMEGRCIGKGLKCGGRSKRSEEGIQAGV